MLAFSLGVLVGLFIAVIVALNVWDRRNPMTPEEQAELDDEMRLW